MPASPRALRPLAIKAFRKAQQHPSGLPASRTRGRLAVGIAKTATSPRLSQPLARLGVCGLTPSIRNGHRRSGRRAKSWSVNALARTERAQAEIFKEKI